MTYSIALPRAKAKRKRRKPMPPKLRWLLFWVCWCAFWTGYDLVKFLGSGRMWDMILAGIMICWFCTFWGDFKREWTAWWKDDD